MKRNKETTKNFKESMKYRGDSLRKSMIDKPLSKLMKGREKDDLN